jgi:hypothetical protein
VFRYPCGIASSSSRSVCGQSTGGASVAAFSVGHGVVGRQQDAEVARGGNRVAVRWRQARRLPTDPTFLH